VAAKASQACVPVFAPHKRWVQRVPAAYSAGVVVQTSVATAAPSARQVAGVVVVAPVALVPGAGTRAAISPFHTHLSRPVVVVVPPMCPTTLVASDTVANLHCTLTLCG